MLRVQKWWRYVRAKEEGKGGAGKGGLRSSRSGKFLRGKKGGGAGGSKRKLMKVVVEAARAKGGGGARGGGRGS